jgi:hypothetical protein
VVRVALGVLIAVEYRYDDNGSLLGFEFVRADAVR